MEEPIEKRETGSVTKDNTPKEDGKVEPRAQQKEGLLSERGHMYFFHRYTPSPAPSRANPDLFCRCPPYYPQSN